MMGPVHLDHLPTVRLGLPPKMNFGFMPVDPPQTPFDQDPAHLLVADLDPLPLPQLLGRELRLEVPVALLDQSDDAVNKRRSQPLRGRSTKATW